MRRRHLISVAGILALSMVLTSCFSVRTFYWSRKSAGSGGSINAVLNLRPYNGDADDGIPFVLVAIKNGDPLTFGTLRTWDALGKFDGPKKMVKDNALRNYVLSHRLCQANGLNASDMTGVTWTAFRAPDSVSYPAGSQGKNAQVKLRINVGTTTIGHVYSVAFFTGEWNDGGDKIPSSADTFGCTGAIMSSFPVTFIVIHL